MMPGKPDQLSKSIMDSDNKIPDLKSVAVLYADIHGYSRLMDRDESSTIVRVTESFSMIRNLIGDYGGEVRNTAGDSVLALFSDSTKALHFALEMQNETAKQAAWSGDQEVIAYRIGISVGHTISNEGEIYGKSINMAARIQSLAKPGGICVSDLVYRDLSDKTNLVIQSLGKQSLKNIAKPVEVYSVATATVQNPPKLIPPLEQQIYNTDSSVAILPLVNVSGDAADIHLSEGIAAEIISNLCRFRNLYVTARHSSFLISAHTKSIREIGQQLGVRYILSGQFQRAGDRIRITIDLIDAHTENIIWSERYDGHMADIFDFLDDVTATTTARLAFHIGMAEKRRVLSNTHPDLDAYGLILRGQDLSFRFKLESNLHARRLFEKAKELDPQYGRSYAAISRTFNVEWRYSWTKDPGAALNEALALAKLAVKNDHLDARGYSELGLAYLYKKQHDEALASYERALELNPNDADLLAEMGDCLVYVRQAERSVELLKRAIRLNPYHPDSYLWFLGDAYFHLGDYEKTIQTVTKMQDQSEGQRLLAASYGLLGQKVEARRHGENVMKVHPKFTIENWRKVPPNKYEEDLEVFIEGLRLAGLK